MMDNQFIFFEKILCNIWTKAKIDIKKRKIFLQGYDLVYIGDKLFKSTLSYKINSDKCWYTYKTLWRDYKKANKIKTYLNVVKEDVLCWNNVRSTTILREEKQKYENSVNLKREEKYLLNRKRKNNDYLFRKTKYDNYILLCDNLKYLENLNKKRERIKQCTT